MSGFEEADVLSTHYQSVDGELIPIPVSEQQHQGGPAMDENTENQENPFPPTKEAEPLKLTIKTQSGELQEFNLWFAGKDPAEMSSMSLVKAFYEVDQMNSKLSDAQVQLWRADLATNHKYKNVDQDLVVVDDNFLDIKNAVNQFMAAVVKTQILGEGETGFRPSSISSVRQLRRGTKEVRLKEKDYYTDEFGFTVRHKRINYIVIDEMHVEEKNGEGKDGWVIRYKSAFFRSNGQHYEKVWPYVLFINKTEKGYRLMWKNSKTGGVIYGLGYGNMARKKFVPPTFEYYTACEINALVKPKDVLKIMEYLKDGDEFNTVRLHPGGISPSDIYWIGDETSIKKILNKAFKHHHGVTKKIFGDINSIDTLDKLRSAIYLLQATRGFNPQIMEKLSIDSVVEFFRGREDKCVKKFSDFFKYFGYREDYLLQMFGVDTLRFVHNNYNGRTRLDHANVYAVIDTIYSFKLIRSRNHRTAIKNQVARNRMSIQEIHNLVDMEVKKIKTENKQFIKSKFWKTFGVHNQKWIADEIQMIVPTTTHELVEWGATQENCIGSYAEKAYNNELMIVGFKNKEGEWLGHAEITRSMRLNQLLGKYNKQLEAKVRSKIVAFMKNELNIDVPSNYWGS